VDLDRPRRILAIATQGRHDYAQWVTKYRLSYRNRPGEAWKRIPKEFLANQDQHTVVRNSLRGYHIKARYVRLQPTGWHGHISMRWDVQYTSKLTDGKKEHEADAHHRKMDELEERQDQITAMTHLIKRGAVRVSSSWATNHNERFCAINDYQPGNAGSWCAKTLDKNQWIEADLSRPRRILGVATQGRHDYAQWVTAYRIMYRNKKSEAWRTVRKDFTGNQDQHTVVRHSLRGYHIRARYVRVQPLSWHGHISMRWDIDYTSALTDGKKEKAHDLAERRLDEMESRTEQEVAMHKLLREHRVKASSVYSATHDLRGLPLNSAIPGHSHSWCARTLNTNQWIDIDLGSPRRILGIATQGRGDYDQWVTKYRIYHRNKPSQAWHSVGRDFLGNQNRNTVVRASLRNDEIKARYVRLQPLEWHGHISLRMDIDYV